MRSLVAALAIALLAISLAACGKTVLDPTKTEEQLASSREKETGQKVIGVDCPSDVEVVAGDSFECAIDEGKGGESTATLKIRNEDADLDVVSIEPSGG
jgi:uncharacterized lipoprotein